MAKLIITQVKSRIGCTANQKKNLDALGLKKLNRTVVHDDSAVILGMIEKVRHLVKIEKHEDGASVKGTAKTKVTAAKSKISVTKDTVSGSSEPEKADSAKKSVKTVKTVPAAKIDNTEESV